MIIKTTGVYWCLTIFDHWAGRFYLFPVQQCQVFDDWGYTVMVYTEMLQEKHDKRDKIGNINGKILINIVYFSTVLP